MFPTFKVIAGKVSTLSFRNASKTFLLFPKTNLHKLNTTSKTDQQKVILDLKSTPEQQNILYEGESRYYIENGLRKVYPYFYQHSVHCKGRWIGRTILDIYHDEFLYPIEHIAQRMLTGALKVNGEIVSLDYRLKNADVLTSNTHRHELPVLATPIKVIYEDDDVFVIDKPPSIPVHPAGLYRFNTLIFMLAEEHNRKDVFLTHRLDRLTSGVLVVAKDRNKSRELHDEMLVRNVQKEYLCRVEGEFPDGVVLCDKPLKQFYKKIGVSMVLPSGKPSLTEFQKLSYNGKSSVVLCRPKTGRTHQIRVHLQFLGYPIVNDPLYNSYCFGPNKGKHGEINKTHTDLLNDLVIKHSASWWLVNIASGEDPIPIVDYSKDVDENLKLELHDQMNISPEDLYSSMSYGVIDKKLQDSVYRKDEARITSDNSCYFCSKVFRDPKPSNLVMFLHAFKYKGENWEFSTEVPQWAQSDWDIL